MTRATDVTLGVLTAVPIVTCAAVAGTMLLTGDPRILAIDLALPAGVAIVGVAVSVLPLSALLARRGRARATARLAESHAAAAQAAASQARAAHRRFLARLDHELKNPLTAIRATAVAAQEGDESDAWRTVDVQATKLSTLVRDLRKLAELESRPLETETVVLEDLLNEAIEALVDQQPAARGRVTLSVTRVPWAVPPLPLDLDLISLAVDNVLSNAAKYSARGPIEVRLREHEGWALIEVADAGRGIPAAELPIVFDELARAQNARDVSGSGIGLSLVTTVMRLHGGDVSIRSAEGAGSLVTLRLPLQRIR